MKPKGSSDSKGGKAAKGKKPSTTKTTTKQIQKRMSMKASPAKGLENDSEDEDLDLENEIDDENALDELELQQGHLQGANEEDDPELLEGFESDSSTSSTEQHIPLPPVPTNREKKLAKKAAKAARDAASHPPTKPGTVYLGHIPHGFFEKQMTSYFSQFGTVTRLRLSRNKKTGKSKHYGWIEFSSRDVAEIVAETMDGYLIHPQRLVCKVVEQVDENVWKGANKVYKKIPWQRINKETLEGKRTKERWEELQKKEDDRMKGRMEKIKEVGIDYEFPLRAEKRKAEEVNEVKEVPSVKSKKAKTEKSGKEKRSTSRGSLKKGKAQK